MKKIIFVAVLILIAFGISFAFADSPVIFFSDLTDGPKTGWEGSSTKGAAVTIWGKNFGSSRGSNYVTVGGVNLTSDFNYSEWDATSNNARGMERITFFLNSSCAIGAGTISVAVNGVTSNTVPFYVRSTGKIYFVDHNNGNDTYNGQYATHGSGSNGPRKTLPSARTLLTSGDILYIRNGTYTEADSASSILFLDPAVNGSVNNNTAFVGYPSEFPILSGGSGGTIRNNYSNSGYTVLSRLRVQPPYAGVRIQYSTVGYYRIIGLEITQSGGGGGAAAALNLLDISNIKIYGCNVHDWGVNLYDHGIYVTENGSYSPLHYDIGWNEFYKLGTEVSGIYVKTQDTYDGLFCDDIIIHDNSCHDLTHAGIFLSNAIKTANCYNNVIYNCGNYTSRATMQISCGSNVTSNITVYNNTLYGSANLGLMLLQWSSNVTMKDNILYALSGTPYFNTSDMAGSITSDYDLYYGNSAPTQAWITHELTSNPLFSDAANYNFNLQSGSPAKDAGTSAVNSLVTKDCNGISRPQGLSYDIGAYEYNTGAPSDTMAPAAVNNLSASAGGPGQINLTWSAPGDDGNTGTASSYIIRYSTSAITTDAQYNAAIDVIGEPAPALAGTNQSMTVSGLRGRRTYYFSMKTLDKVANLSALSNCPSAIAPNNPPVLNAIGNKTVNEAGTLSFTISATDPEGDALTYSVSGLPSGATFSSSTKTFSWTPSYSQSGSYQVTFAVSDGTLTDNETITISVGNTNHAPILNAIGNKTVNAGNNLSFTISASDQDGNTLIYSDSGLPSGASFNTSTKTFSWTPAIGQAGSYNVTFSVSDGSASDSETIAITVNSVVIPPASGITISASASPVSGTAPLSVNFTASATSKNGAIVRYEWDFEGGGNFAWKSSQTANTTYVYSGAGNYLAALKVTDASGAQDTYSILIQPQQNPNAPSVGVTTDTTSGTAPLKVYFKVNASSSTGIAKYEWDFDGDGIYEYESSRSGDVVKTYSQSGTYIASLKVTDFSALSTIKNVNLNILNNPLAPKIGLSFTSASGTAPYTVTLSAINKGDDNLLRYEWDFNGDGVYDRSTYDTTQVTYTYMRPGTFGPCVRVTNKNNLTSTASSMVTIKDSATLTRPVASFTTTPSQGEVPLKVTLTNQSQGTIDSSIWDFNGDRSDDYALSGKPNVSYYYDESGYYLVNLKVISSDGLMDQVSKQVKITALNSTPIVLVEPKDSEVVKGDISLAVLIDPRISPAQVKYQYQLTGTSTWSDIGNATVYPYSLKWNTSTIQNSTYLIRAVAINANNQNFISASITLIVNSQFTDPDTQENVSATGEYVKQTKIDTSKLEEIYLFDGTQIEMPYQTVNQDDVLSITIVDPNKLANKINSTNPNITDINSYRDISLASNTSLLDKEVTMIVPYDDKDNDGYVDGTTIKEQTLDIYTYNETTKEWTKIFDCIVHPDENFVEGKTNHFTLFGLGGTQDATGSSGGGGGGGGGGGCFIATAAFGTSMAKEVRILKHFRDKYMMRDLLGRELIRLYYKTSPPIADYIRDKEWARRIVRITLKPVIWIAGLF